MISFFLLAFKWMRAYIVMRHNSIAKDYLDPLAATWLSLRSFQRFLVFAALTESRNSEDYMALFTYFAFKGAVETIVANGPRQCINAITLYAFINQSLLPKGAPENANTFFSNMRILFQDQSEHAIILFTMLFTLVVWAFSMASLTTAASTYVGYLCHQVDSHLSRYCARKIEKRLRRLLNQPTSESLKDEDRELIQAMQEGRSARWSRNDGMSYMDDHRRQKLGPQPTLPCISEYPVDSPYGWGPGPSPSTSSFSSRCSTCSRSRSSYSSFCSCSSYTSSSGNTNPLPFRHQNRRRSRLSKLYPHVPPPFHQPPTHGRYGQSLRQSSREPRSKIHPVPLEMRTKPEPGVPMGRYKPPPGKIPVKVVPGPMYGGWGQRDDGPVGGLDRDPAGHVGQPAYLDAKYMESIGVR
ncbi:MAG: hypothetical protein Q9159_003941 [Coniocarpon cinnabarinum]